MSETKEVLVDSSENIRFRERFGYSLGDFGSNMAWQMVTNFILIFYTDVFLISPGYIGTMLLINRVWDAINDPIIGWVTDRTRSKKGAFRPYLLYGAVPFGILLVLAFTAPDFDMTGKVAWMYVTFFALEAVYTVVNVPYSSMVPAMTQNPDQRAKLAAARFLGSNLGMVVVAIILPGVKGALVEGGLAESTAYVILTSVLAVIGVVSLLLCYKFTTERYTSEQDKKLSFTDMIKALKSNGPLWISMLCLFFFFTGMTFRNTLTLHYFKWYLGDEAMAGAAMGAMAISAILGSVFAAWIIKKIDKKWTVVIGLSFISISSLVWFFIGGKLPIVVIGSALGGFGMILTAVAIIAMTADTVEYAQWKTGIRAAGIVSAMFISVSKLATGVGSSLSAYILEWTGYSPIPTGGVQSPLVLTWIHRCMSLIPGIFGLLGILAIFFYTLNRDKYNGILQELKTK